jgi:hypothetical protein
MFCAPQHVFSGVECVVSRFHVLCVRTHFWPSRGQRVPFSCFACPKSFSAVPSASGPIFMFCASKLISDGTEGVRSRFHVYRSRTCFRRCGGRRVPFSCLTLPDMFLAVPRASGPVFMFCTSGLIFGGIEGFDSRFHVLCYRTHFRRYRGRRVSISCFALPDSFLAVPRGSGAVFIFCAPDLIFDGTEGIGSRFLVLRSRARFRRYRGR